VCPGRSSRGVWTPAAGIREVLLIRLSLCMARALQCVHFMNPSKCSPVLAVACFLAATPALAASDVRVVIPAPAAQYVYDDIQYGIVVSNIGNQSAAAVKLTVDLPATHTSPTKHVMGTLAGVDPRCVLAGQRLTCTLGTIAKNKSTVVAFAIALPEAAEVLSISAAATTTSAENSLANNAAGNTPTLLNYAVAVVDGDLGVNTHCTGTGLTSFFECTLFPGSLSAHDVVFHGDGTLSFVDAPPEYSGVWSQDSADSLAFTYFAGDVPVAEFVGHGAAPGCFEGVTVFPDSSYVAPYEVCV
jgi:hypothetical protein